MRRDHYRRWDQSDLYPIGLIDKPPGGLSATPARWSPGTLSASEQLEWVQSMSRVLGTELTEDQDRLFDRYKTRFEQAMAQCAMTLCEQNQSEAARRLGISRNTLARILNESS